MTEEEERKAHLDRFYGLMDRLRERTGGPTPLTMKKCKGLNWPEQGVFFGFEHGESRDNDSPRVVWVATHGKKEGDRTTLWQRLENHLGYSGKSVLRKHIGRALMASCGTKQMDKERIDNHLEKMEILVARVPGEPMKNTPRNIIIKKSIALLSNRRSPLDSPSDDWLGLSSHNEKISESGLWNVEHLNDRYDPDSPDSRKFLDKLESCIENTKPL